jgi:hypothetical protein
VRQAAAGQAPATTVTIGAPRPVVPGPGLPAGVRVDRSNNNLDVIDHDDRLYLAWRTAPIHFASPEAALHVVASGDGGATWAHDLTIEQGRDVREPRFVSWQGRLLLYWFSAGTRAAAFEPDVIWVRERFGDGTWSEPVAISPPDCVVWRVRPVAGRLMMTLYRGAGSLFTTAPVPLTVEAWVSDDGLTWGPLDPARPVVHEGGSETDFLELDDGRVIAVVRKEGPEAGWGADVCVSEPGPSPAALARWRLRPDPRKFDSPYLFLAGAQPMLITRRQVAFGGEFDLGLRALPLAVRTKIDQIAYWLTPKRTAIYAIDPERLTAVWCTDLPSAGDTAFAGSVPLASRDGDAATTTRHLVFNYSSPVDRGWYPWVVGQLRPTHIYAIEVAVHTEH